MDRRRFWLVVSLLPAYLVGLVVVSSLLAVLMYADDGLAGRLDAFVELLTDGEWWAWMLPISAVFTATQAVFLIPVARVRPPRGDRPRSLAVSLALGGVVAAFLTLGIALAVTELAAQVMRFGDGDPWPGDGDMLDEAWPAAAALVVLFGSWILWTLLLLLFTRQAWSDTAVGRLVRLLFAGTAIELVLVIPIDVMVRRRTDCYCATGTFFSLAFGATAVLWLTGPGVVLAVTARRRRLRKRAYCPKCGYGKGATPGERCPECGAQWGRLVR